MPATLTVDGEVVTKRWVRVPAGETRTVTLEHRFEEPGTYRVGIRGGGTRTLTVESTPTEEPETATEAPTATETVTSPPTATESPTASPSEELAGFDWGAFGLLALLAGCGAGIYLIRARL